jgi:hypothetical protein
MIKLIKMSNRYNKLITLSLGFVLLAGMSAFAQRNGGSRSGSGGGRSISPGSISRPGRAEGSAPRQFTHPPAAAGGFHQNTGSGFTPRNPATTIPRQSFTGQRPGGIASRPPSSSFNNRNNFNNRGSNFYGNRYNPSRPAGYNGYRNGYNYGRHPNYRFYYSGAYHPHPSYYRPYNRPTFGIRLSILPRGYYPFYVGPNRYFFDNGNYYRYYDNYYETIAPPFGAVVPSLPGGAVIVVIGGRSYYEYTGTYYEPRVDPYGATTYAVVGTDGVLQQDRDSADIISDESIQSNMEGADAAQQQAELPSTYKTVTLDNKTYYVSPSGDYYIKNIDEDGKVTYQLTTKAQ